MAFFSDLGLGLLEEDVASHSLDRQVVQGDVTGFTAFGQRHNPVATAQVKVLDLGIEGFSPSATVRLLPSQEGTSRIRRMAVKRQLRGTGLGMAVLQALIDKARERGDQVVVLHAQLSAKGFYQKAGFDPQGETFEEAGITHIEMCHSLSSSK